MNYLKAVDYTHAEFGDWCDELPLWSAPFGLRLLDRVPMKTGLTILDAGAGTGFMTLELAQRCGPKTTVIAVDPWGAAMTRLRKKVAHLNLGNVILLEQDVETMGVPEGSVDVVVSNLGINNFENAGAAMAALYRVTKPDGRLFLATNLAGHMAEFYEVFRTTLIELGQSDRLVALEDHINHRGTVESVVGMIREPGFEIVNTETDSFRLRFADGSTLLRHFFIRLGFIQGWASVISADALQETFETLESNLNMFAADRGELALSIPMACIEARKPGAGAN